MAVRKKMKAGVPETDDAALRNAPDAVRAGAEK
jgi:hypothetical protein